MNPDRSSTNSEIENDDQLSSEDYHEETIQNIEENSGVDNDRLEEESEGLIRSNFIDHEDSPEPASSSSKNPIEKLIKSVRDFFFQDTEDIGRQSSPSIDSVENRQRLSSETQPSGFEELEENTLDRLTDSVQLSTTDNMIGDDMWSVNRSNNQTPHQDTAEIDRSLSDDQIRRRLTGELSEAQDMPMIPTDEEDFSPFASFNEEEGVVPPPRNTENDELRQFLSQMDEDDSPSYAASNKSTNQKGYVNPPPTQPFKPFSQPEEELDNLLFGNSLEYDDTSEPEIDELGEIFVHEKDEQPSLEPDINDEFPEASSIFLNDADTLFSKDDDESDQDITADRIAGLRSNYFDQPEEDESQNPYEFYPGELEPHAPVFTFDDETQISPIFTPEEDEETYQPPFSQQKETEDDFFESIRRRTLLEQESEEESPYHQFSIEPEEDDDNLLKENESPRTYPYSYDIDDMATDKEAQQFLQGNFSQDAASYNENISRYLDSITADNTEDSPAIGMDDVKVQEIKSRRFLPKIDLNSREFMIISASLAGIILLAVITIFLTRNLGNINLPAISLPTRQPVTEVYPVGMKLPGGWYFDIQKSYMENGVWKPQAAEWLEGSSLRRVIAIPWNEQTEAVVRTFTKGDKIQLYLSNNDLVAYQVTEVKQVSVNDTEILSSVKPSLLIILYQAKTEMRWVVIAE